MHLEQALIDPSKDLDLLAAKHDCDRVVGILGELGYRRLEAPGPTLPGAEHWVAYDAARGVLDHVHVHHELHAGRPPIYEWRLPWEDYLLAHTALHPSIEGTVLEPELELVLLAVRAAIEPKHRRGDVLAPGSRADIAQLRALADPGRVRAHAAALLGAEAAAELEAGLGDLKRWRTLVERSLSGSRRLTRIRASASWGAHVAASAGRGVARRLGFTPPPRRGLRVPEGGLLVAVIGPDGAGKSTLTREIGAWLGVLVDVEPLYLGRGEWVSRAQQVLAEAKWAALETFAGRRRPAPTGPVDDSGTGERARSADSKVRLLQIGRDAQRVALARRKRRDLARGAALRRRGVVVLTDRFPHPELIELDGPGIRVGPSDPRWRRLLARLERRQFRRMRSVAPDLVLRLHIDPAVAHARKPDHLLGDIERKAAAVERASFGAARVVEVDAAMPPDEVGRVARQAIWEALCR